MGRDKATLPFGPELMLERVVRQLSECVEPGDIIVVAAPEQFLPALPKRIVIARDDVEFRGPLQGLATGLRAIGDRLDAVYATGCDVPLFVPAFARRMFGLLGDYDIAVPSDGERDHPLAAVYQPRVLPHIERLLAANRLRPVFLFDEVPTRRVPVDELRDVDPQLLTLANLNSYEDYLKALEMAGFAAPDEVG